MTFDQQSAVARQIVASAQKRLPPAIRPFAEGVPVSYETVPSTELVADGLEPDILGLFVGHEHGADLLEDAPLPPQIILFLENLWDWAEGDERIFRDEIRLTYLHELGHYLGWDEEEIAERGLE